MSEMIYFIGLSSIILLSAILVITVEDIFKSALFLALLFVGTAGMFITLNAEFLAAVQILVYAGAVTIMVLFAIMLTKDMEDSR